MPHPPSLEVTKTCDSQGETNNTIKIKKKKNPTTTQSYVFVHKLMMSVHGLGL